MLDVIGDLPMPLSTTEFSEVSSAPWSWLRNFCTAVVILILGICTGTLIAQSRIFDFDLSNLHRVSLRTSGSAEQTNGGFLTPPSDVGIRHHEPQPHYSTGVRMAATHNNL